MIMKTTVKYYKDKYANDVIRERDGYFPAELKEISKKWTELQRTVGDHGSCVLGAGFLFKYQKKWYFMSPQGGYQGSISWERHYKVIEAMLDDLGVTDLRYEWGNMD